MHGDREPHGKPLSDKGGGLCTSGADNEIWSFGKEVESILVTHLQLRERLRPYNSLRSVRLGPAPRDCSRGAFAHREQVVGGQDSPGL